jgi:hypothetical protein
MTRYLIAAWLIGIALVIALGVLRDFRKGRP